VQSARAVPVSNIVKLIETKSFFRLFKCVLLRFDLGNCFLYGALRTRMPERAALNTSQEMLTQGFYH